MNRQIAVFLDLQGTLGEEGLGDIRHFVFCPFAIPATELLNEANLLTVAITNQSHIAKGEFTYEYFEETKMQVCWKLVTTSRSMSNHQAGQPDY